MLKLQVQTSKKRTVIDLTDQIQSSLEKMGIDQGNLNIFIKHTTAAITTADLDPGTDLDTLEFLEALIPKLKYRHPHNPDHAPDHILASIIGSSLTLPIENGQLVLGAWQRVILFELDGPRDREIILS